MLASSAMASDALQYQAGFGNEFQTEAEPGALPIGRSNPQTPPLGLSLELVAEAEEINGTPFTAPRGQSRRSWTYRIRPSATHKPFRQVSTGTFRSAPFDEVPASPNQLRWRPLPIPAAPTDFVQGIVTYGGNGDPGQQVGAAMHMYAANTSMVDRFFYDADGEVLIVPQQGTLLVRTELGALRVAPREMCVIPRGIKFRVELPDGAARGYLCENYGPHF